jgi:hypothetical protein
MTLKAKEVLKGKFWIVEEHGNKIGTLSASEDCYLYNCQTGTEVFGNISQLKKRFGKISWSNSNSEPTTATEHEVHGYKTSCEPFNPLYDVKRRLPLFSKSNKSKSLYCAGYYIIQFEKGWVKSFCPKLITVERYTTKGPFKTEIEMRQELSRVNK